MPGLDETIPAPLQRIFNAPYNEGLIAVSGLVRARGRSFIDEVLGAPPASTEQLLHPEKLDAAEPPRSVPLPALAGSLGPDWRALRQNTLGEFVLSTILRDHVGHTAALAAAAGWGSDRLILYEHVESGELLLVGRLLWDDAVEAGEFHAIWGRWLSSRGAQELAVLGGTHEATLAGRRSRGGAFGARRSSMRPGSRSATRQRPLKS